MTKTAVHPSNLTAQMARFMAELAPSVTRGQPANVRKCAVEYLKCNAVALLSDLADPKTFRARLDTRTEELQLRLPGHSWGVARKCLNIFLRDAAFNFRLRDVYKLDQLEPCLEVPLDSRVRDHLRAKYPGLQRWATIKGLSPQISAAYQDAATEIARRACVHRVYLDIWYFPNDAADRALENENK